MIDMFDFYLQISGSKYLQIGLAITIIYQMVRFGMDTNAKKDDGRSHVGMENTKRRIREMCGGTYCLSIDGDISKDFRVRG